MFESAMLIEVYIYVYFRFDVKLSNKNSEEIMDVFKNWETVQKNIRKGY